ncbi:hypothetical protein B7486_66435 [cyanobacterium TDX16]|nr:hypothetical protein B7486_66435 [cyanobacterium TDX16]
MPELLIGVAALVWGVVYFFVLGDRLFAWTVRSGVFPERGTSAGDLQYRTMKLGSLVLAGAGILFIVVGIADLAG